MFVLEMQCWRPIVMQVENGVSDCPGNFVLCSLLLNVAQFRWSYKDDGDDDRDEEVFSALFC